MDITVACRYWALKLPGNWSVRNEEDCVTFTGTPDLGALQVSAREKEIGVDNDDLIQFATERVNPESRLHPVAIGSLVGFYAQSVHDDTLWREWWLRHGRIMVYITYNVEESEAGEEDDLLDEIFKTLRLREENSHEVGGSIFEHF